MEVQAINTILFILWLHFIGDFLLQTDKMALNKSSSFKWLGLHSFVYSLPLLFLGIEYAIINGILHLMVDYVSSKVTSYLWKNNKRHWFFTTIGFDQAIHLTLLLGTVGYING